MARFAPGLPTADDAADTLSAQERFRARQAARRRADRARWTRPLLALAVLAALAGAGFWVVWFSSWVTSHEVTVVGTGKATQMIKTGQRLRVDGTRGLVRILD